MKKPSEFWRGVRDGFPVYVAVTVFAIVYGALATEKGLTFFEGILLSATVYAGASQFMVLQFWQEPLPFLTIVLVVFAINFRHVLYGASLSGKLAKFSTVQKFVAFFFLSDPSFALSEKRHEEGKGIPGDVGLTPAYYFGIIAALYPVWLIASMIGLAFGNLIERPETYGIDFILPIYFMVLLLGFRARANWFWVVLASGLATFVALVTVGSPWHISSGALVGVVTGAFLGAPDASKEQS